MPASQIDIIPPKNLAQFIGNSYEFKVVMEEVIQRNSATAEENAAAAEELSGQSHALRGIAGDLNLMVG